MRSPCWVVDFVRRVPEQMRGWFRDIEALQETGTTVCADTEDRWRTVSGPCQWLSGASVEPRRHHPTEGARGSARTTVMSKGHAERWNGSGCTGNAIGREGWPMQWWRHHDGRAFFFFLHGALRREMRREMRDIGRSKGHRRREMAWQWWDPWDAGWARDPAC